MSYSRFCTAKSEINKVKEDIERMFKEKGEICSQILEKQRKVASLESDSSTLAQVASKFVYASVWIISHFDIELGPKGKT